MSKRGIVPGVMRLREIVILSTYDEWVMDRDVYLSLGMEPRLGPAARLKLLPLPGPHPLYIICIGWKNVLIIG